MPAELMQHDFRMADLYWASRARGSSARPVEDAACGFFFGPAHAHERLLHGPKTVTTCNPSAMVSRHLASTARPSRRRPRFSDAQRTSGIQAAARSPADAHTSLCRGSTNARANHHRGAARWRRCRGVAADITKAYCAYARAGHRGGKDGPCGGAGETGGGAVTRGVWRGVNAGAHPDRAGLAVRADAAGKNG